MCDWLRVNPERKKASSFVSSMNHKRRLFAGTVSDFHKEKRSSFLFDKYSLKYYILFMTAITTENPPLLELVPTTLKI